MNRIEAIVFNPVNLEKSCESCPFEASILVNTFPETPLTQMASLVGANSFAPTVPERALSSKILLIGEKPIIGVSETLFQSDAGLPAQGLESGDIQ